MVRVLRLGQGGAHSLWSCGYARTRLGCAPFAPGPSMRRRTIRRRRSSAGRSKEVSSSARGSLRQRNHTANEATLLVRCNCARRSSPLRLVRIQSPCEVHCTKVRPCGPPSQPARRKPQAASAAAKALVHSTAAPLSAPAYTKHSKGAAAARAMLHTASSRSARRTRSSRISAGELVEDLQPSRIRRSFAPHEVGEQLRIRQVQQRLKRLLFGGRSARIAFPEIAFEQDVEFAHAATAAPSKRRSGERWAIGG